jgi:hypothetical protein
VTANTCETCRVPSGYGECGACTDARLAARARVRACRLAVFRATIGFALFELPAAARTCRLTLAPEDDGGAPAVLLPDPEGYWRSVAEDAAFDYGPALARLAGRYGVHPGRPAVVEEVVAARVPPMVPANRGASRLVRWDHAVNFGRFRETIAAVARRAVAGADTCRGK